VIKNQVLLHFDDPSQLPTSPIPIDIPSSEEVINVTNNHGTNQQYYNNNLHVGMSNQIPADQFNQQNDMQLQYNERPYSPNHPNGLVHQTSQESVKLEVNEKNFSSEPLMKKDI
jgi:hypothetical protein